MTTAVPVAVSQHAGPVVLYVLVDVTPRLSFFSYYSNRHVTTAVGLLSSSSAFFFNIQKRRLTTFKPYFLVVVLYILSYFMLIGDHRLVEGLLEGRALLLGRLLLRTRPHSDRPPPLAGLLARLVSYLSGLVL